MNNSQLSGATADTGNQEKSCKSYGHTMCLFHGENQRPMYKICWFPVGERRTHY